MKPYIINAEMHLKNIIAESREVAQALKDFADRLEQIEKKYADKPEADRQEQEKSYGVYEVYTWDDVTYELIEKYETRSEAEARAAEEKQKKREKFKPSESMPVSPFSYTVLSDTEYENLMNNAKEASI